MSRRDEAEASIKSILHCAENFRVESAALQHLSETLADEVDARDKIITELLAMLRPERPEPEKPKNATLKIWFQWVADATQRKITSSLYARACEIAGRAK